MESPAAGGEGFSATKRVRRATTFWKTGCTQKGAALRRRNFHSWAKLQACREKETEIATGGIVVKTASLHIVADDIMQK